MKLKALVVFFISIFIFAQIVLVSLTLTLVAFFENKNSREFENIRIESMLRVYQDAIISEAILDHEEAIKPLLNRISSEYDLSLELHGVNGKIIKSDNSFDGPAISTTRDINFDGTNYGKLVVRAKNRAWIYSYRRVIFVFVLFQIGIFSTLFYFLYSWGVKNLIQPLEKVAHAAGKNGEFHIDKLAGVPYEITQIILTFERLWIAQQSKVEAETFKKISRQVAHDIRSPLFALKFVSETRLNIPEDINHLLKSSVNRINSIANNLLDTKEVSKEKYFNLAIAIQEVLLEKRVAIESKSSTRLSVKYPVDALSAMVCGQAQEFKRVFSNLLNNALEACVETQPEIAISIGCESNLCTLLIEDNGKGIPKDLQQRVFESGFSYDKAGGTGLGLAHAKELVVLWGGSIWAESDGKTGTKMFLTLKRVKQPSAWTNVLRLNRKKDKTTVLAIIDDDLSSAELLNRAIKESVSDIEVQILKPDQDINLRLKILPPETTLVIDYNLGISQNGLTLAHSLRSRFNDIYLVTSDYSEPNVVREALNLSIPIVPKVFFNKLQFMYNLDPSLSKSFDSSS